jgi:hypothetical protein
MKNQTINLALFLFILHGSIFGQSDKIIARQGKVSFFSYTAVENIEATNNQVISIIDRESGEIAVQMLMRAFVFKKALMEEHFNESYVESDTYPKLTFSGTTNALKGEEFNDAPIFIKGIMDFHGVQKPVEIKTMVKTSTDTFVLEGDFNVNIADFAITVPPLLVPNISKEIQVMFRFEYAPYE